MSRMPTVFISHGAPDVAVAQTEASAFLARFAAELPKPEAIVVVSAHFEAQGAVFVSADAEPETIHDFGNFDPRLFEMRYRAPGAPALAAEIAGSLRAAGLRAGIAENRGFDHGTWVPLILAYPEADIPVVQVSVDPSEGPDHHLRLGEALAPLRDRGILVVGSGSFTHNLREAFARMQRGVRRDATPAWVSAFSDWMTERLVAGDRAALADYRRLAPHARENHPTDEHLMPLYAALGAAGEGAVARRLHSSRDFGVLAMEAFAFN